MGSWRLETYDDERLLTPKNLHNGSGIIGICHRDVVEYQWCASQQHCGDTLRILTRYYRSDAAIEQLRLYMQRHGHFVLAPRVSLCTGAGPHGVSKMNRSGWEEGTGHYDSTPGVYGNIFMHENDAWWVRGVSNLWVKADSLFAKVLA